MTETDAPQSAAQDGIWSRLRILPVFIFVIPPMLVSKLLGEGHWALFFASFIPGALSVALWSPSRLRKNSTFER